jgi:hypothetical protein
MIQNIQNILNFNKNLNLNFFKTRFPPHSKTIFKLHIRTLHMSEIIYFYCLFFNYIRKPLIIGINPNHESCRALLPKSLVFFS